MRHLKIFVVFAFVLFVSSSCKEKYNPLEDNEVYVVNSWIRETLDTYYFWYKNMPSTPPNEKDNPNSYFNSLLYSELDHWSYLTNDYASLNADLAGVPVSMGYSPSFHKMKNSDQVFIMVKYVYDNSPAKRSGLKRGDIILKINDTKLTTSNYSSLAFGSSYKATLADYDDGTFNENGKTVEMTAETIRVNPVVFDTIYEKNGRLIGYFALTEFIDYNRFVSYLSPVFSKFKEQNINELIVDLRYNGGGYINSAQWLASSIAPASVVNSKSLLVNLLFNNKITSQLPDDRRAHRFIPNEYNLNLSKVYFMAAHGSASASELTIIGLKPYMDVVVVGDSTYGKYTGMWVLTDEHKPPRHNWAMMPIVTKYSNADGYTDFVDGLIPDVLVKDNLLQLVPFGDESDPILSKTLELITGSKSKKTLKAQPNYETLITAKQARRMNLFIQPTIAVE